MGTCITLRPSLGSVRHDKPSYSKSPLANAAEQLLQLNFQFLSIVNDHGFSASFASQLRNSSIKQRLIMADCRFSLFTLALHDSRRWLSLLIAAAPVDESALAELSIIASQRDTRSEFAMTALFLVWHLVQVQPFAAKFLFDIHDSVAAALRNVPIAHLRSIACRASEWLAPRWPQHPIFWPALLRYSENCTSDGLALTKSLGRQLLAAESLDRQQFLSKNLVGQQIATDVRERNSSSSLRMRRPSASRQEPFGPTASFQPASVSVESG